MHLEEGGLGGGEFLGGGGVEAGGDVISEGGDMNGEAVEGVLFQRSGGGGDDDIFGTGFPGVAEEFVEGADFDVVVRGEDGDALAGGI